MGCPCVPEVIAHETLDALTWLGARISQYVGRSPASHDSGCSDSFRHSGATSNALAEGNPRPDRRVPDALSLAQEQRTFSIAIVRAAVRSRSAPGRLFHIRLQPVERCVESRACRASINPSSDFKMCACVAAV